MARAALAPAPGEDPHPVWGRVLVRAQETDIPSIDQALEIASSVGHEAEVAHCLRTRGWQRCQERKFAHALRDLHDSLSIFRRLNDRYGMAWTVANMTHVNMVVGDWEAAKICIERGQELGDETGCPTWKHDFVRYAAWTACYYGRRDGSAPVGGG
jgi:hypothetical protein